MPVVAVKECACCNIPDAHNSVKQASRFLAGALWTCTRCVCKHIYAVWSWGYLMGSDSCGRVQVGGLRKKNVFRWLAPTPTCFNADADKPLKQTRPVDHVSPQTIPTQAHAPLPVRMPTTNSNMVDALSALQHPQLVICLPGRHMD